MTSKNPFKYFNSSPEIIQLAVMYYVRYPLSFRQVEDILSERGVDFNSLDAQREACSAFIKSQAAEGWVELPTLYDDGGISGGTLERPALQQLLHGIDKGFVDQIVVYKIDRLTRSLSDFAKIVDRLEAGKASFVSVTQSFNTATSMGRLTLNMFLSFAQFEREVTAERIRDKIAASKKKGLWMGGAVPLGYDIKDKALIINNQEAEQVRMLYGLYLERGSVRLLKQACDQKNFTSKVSLGKNGTVRGGKPLSRGQLYRLLSNPLYRGKVAYKNQVYEGRHKAIIDQDLWQAVQEQLHTNRQGSTRHASNEQALLKGLIQTEQGQTLIPSFCVKQGKRYHYYVSPSFGERESPKVSYAADRLEAQVLHIIKAKLEDQDWLWQAFKADLQAGDPTPLFQKAQSLAANLGTDKGLLRALIDKIIIGPAEVILHLNKQDLCAALEVERQDANLQESLILKASTKALKQPASKAVYLNKGKAEAQTRVSSLVLEIAKARDWYKDLKSGKAYSLAEIGKKHSLDKATVSRCVRLAFLSPKITAAIIEQGTAYPFSLEDLVKKQSMPLDWHNQEKHFL